MVLCMHGLRFEKLIFVGLLSLFDFCKVESWPFYKTKNGCYIEQRSFVSEMCRKLKIAPKLLRILACRWLIHVTASRLSDSAWYMSESTRVSCQAVWQMKNSRRIAVCAVLLAWRSVGIYPTKKRHEKVWKIRYSQLSPRPILAICSGGGGGGGITIVETKSSFVLTFSANFMQVAWNESFCCFGCQFKTD